MGGHNVAETVDERVARLEEQMQALLRVVADQAATIEAYERTATPPWSVHPEVASEPAPAAPHVSPADARGEPEPDPTMGRRRLLLGGATATAAAAVAVAAGTASPAAAANGGSLILGQTNDATAETKLAYGGSGTNGLRVEGGSSLALIEGYQSGSAAAVKGANTSTGNGVEGLATSGYGVYGESSGRAVVGKSTGGGQAIRGVTTGAGSGVVGLANDAGGVGVYGEGEKAVFGVGKNYGVFAATTGDAGSVAVFAQGVLAGVQGVGTTAGSTGVHGQASAIGVAAVGLDDGTGLYAYATGGGVGANVTSVSGIGTVSRGAKANLHLPVRDGRLAPTADGIAHSVGELVVDGTGDVWLCIVDGTPGQWRKIGGPATAGAFHVLPAPVRVYDSRPGTFPGQGPKTPLSGNVARPIDCTQNNSKVPIDATAVSLTVLIVNAANGNGNLTIWANGVARPSANTAVWGAGSGRYTTVAVSAVDAAAKIQVAASNTTDLVLDVVGYYR